MKVFFSAKTAKPNKFCMTVAQNLSINPPYEKITDVDTSLEFVTPLQPRFVSGPLRPPLPKKSKASDASVLEFKHRATFSVQFV